MNRKTIWLYFLHYLRLKVFQYLKLKSFCFVRVKTLLNDQKSTTNFNFLNLSLLFIIIFCGSLNAQIFKSEGGQWYKLGYQNSGVYSISLSFLKKHIKNIQQTNPQNIRVFASSPYQLPEANSEEKHGYLREIPVWCTDTDQKFDEKDRIYFFGNSPHFEGLDSLGRFYHQINPYSDSAYVFINISEKPSLKIKPQLIETELTNTPISNSLDYYNYEEKELKNILNSGRQWFGDFFFSQYTKDFSFENTESPVEINCRIMGIGRSDQSLFIKSGNNTLYQQILPKSTYNSSDAYARYNRYSDTHDLKIETNQNNLSLNLSLSVNNSPSAGAYIDYWSYNYKRTISLKNESIIFWKKPKEGSSYKVSSYNEKQHIWEISDPINPKEIVIDQTGGFTFGNISNTASKIILFDEENGNIPSFAGTVSQNTDIENANPDLIIVFPEKLRQESQKLIENKREAFGYKVLGISTQEIYNTFSGGKTDPTAIRDMCRLLWKKPGSQLKFLILVGDASFDYKNNLNAGFVDKQLLIPSYQSRESLEPIYSYNTDDYFGFLEHGEGYIPEGSRINGQWKSPRNFMPTLDISVGRLPVKSRLEAKNLISKIIKYSKFSSDSHWQNIISMVADNRDYNLHQQDAEGLSELAQNQFPGFKINKIYLDQFPIQNTNAGDLSPQATKALNNQVSKGSLIINYNGHGAEDGWGQEKILTIGDIINWRNTRLPILFTATCQFGKFDNPALVSGAELALNLPNGGAIALLTTTRPVYSSTNEKINKAFYSNLTESKTLGECFLKTKNASVEGELNLNFALLGDPSLPLPTLKNKLTISTIDNQNPKNATLLPLKSYQFKGKSESIKNGKIKVELLDKPINQKTLGTYPDGPAFQYSTQTQKIFEGVYDINNFEFQFPITLSQNQAPGTGKGQLFMYGIDTDSSITQFGYYNDFELSNLAEAVLIDKSPPEIILKNEKAIVIEVFDENGLNISTVTDVNKPQVIINDSLVLDLESILVFIEGNKLAQIRIPNTLLKNGENFLSVSFSDINNNKSFKTFSIKIEKPKLEIKAFFGYPNPFSSYTNLEFIINRPGDNLEARLMVFDHYGRSIGQYQQNCENCNEKIEFGLDFEGKSYTGNQLYFKLLLISALDNTQAESSGRLLFWK